MASKSPLQQLLELQREIYHLNAAQSLLHWDQRTVMPAGANAVRAETLATMAGLLHERVTSKKLGKLINTLHADNDLSLEGRAQLREATRNYRLATLLPATLVKQIAATAAQTQQAWVEARQRRDFKNFAPHLQRLFDLKCREADLRLNSGVGDYHELYDALLDEYEPGMTAMQLAPLFAELRSFLTPALRAVVGSGRSPGDKLHDLFGDPKGPRFSVAAQRACGAALLKQIGFDFTHGRLDESVHPFCIGVASDTRLTTRYDERQPLLSLYGMLHEAGHGMYTQGLPSSLQGTPAGEYRSLGVHESQSLLWENQVGHRREFCAFLAPLLNQHLPTTHFAAEELYGYVNRVQPSFIRVDADEVTYILHIVVRFEIERDLCEGRLRIADLPQRWNDLYESYLGIRPTHDADGVLQDIHWSSGSFGYFPTYALGNLLAAQLFATASRELPGLVSSLGRGEFTGLLDWLRRKVHTQGSLLSTDALVRQATGEPLGTAAFKDYIRGKLLNLYGVTL